MFESLKKVLVLAPHTDDGELGAGATIAKLTQAGVEVHYVAFSIAEDSVLAHLPKDILFHEARGATLCLGILPQHLYIHRFPVRRLQDYRQDILEIMVKLQKEHAYDLVLTPSRNDIHQDHQVVAEEAIRAFKNTSILGYELPWNNLLFQNTCFFVVNAEHLNKKIKALQAYDSQAHRNYVSEDFIKSLALVRGVQIGVQFAEMFEVIRWIIR